VSTDQVRPVDEFENRVYAGNRVALPRILPAVGYQIMKTIKVMKTKTVPFVSATGGVLFAALAFNLAASGSAPRVYAQDNTQQQPTAVLQTIQSTVQNAIAAGTERTDSFGIRQVYVPAGCFMMGTTDAQAQDAIAQLIKDGVSQSNAQRWVSAEEPQHQVCITKTYWLDEFEVTNAAFDTFVKANGYSSNSLWSSGGLSWKQNINGPEPDCTQFSIQSNQPRVCVSYYEAEAYAKWRTCRLPTEAEWEYAARGSTGSIYPWGDTFDQSKANTLENNIGKATAVDAYPTGKSWVGAYDMAGNVWQWVADWYDAGYYSSSAKDDPTGPTSGQFRVLRGGSSADFHYYARAAVRGPSNPVNQYGGIGFRVLCSIPASDAAQATTMAATSTGAAAATVAATSTAAPASTKAATAAATKASTYAAPTASANALAAGTERTDSFGIKQVYVPAGCFMMGSSNTQAQDAIAQDVKDGMLQSDAQQIIGTEQPQHQVCITKAHWFDEFDVTNAAFDAFTKAGDYTNNSLWSADGLSWKQSRKITGPDTSCTSFSNQPNQPRVCVSYYEAEAYAKWRACRLPTEAEWEYAARGTDGRIYPWGDAFSSSKANTNEDGIFRTTLVNAYPQGRSWVGAYDMAGNVWQWIGDWYSAGYYTISAKNDPTGPSSGVLRVLRGGGWDAQSRHARAAIRDGTGPGARYSVFGFRVLCSVPV
jgi:iron(II)-dependent oxidoreductase